MNRTSGAALRQKILQEAIGIVYREGAERITMRALADALGYSPATIYLHFRNKQELIQEIARFGFSRLDELLRPAIESDDPVEALRHVIRVYTDFALENPQLYRLMYQDLELEPNEAEEQLFRLHHEVYQRGIEKGVFRPGEPRKQGAMTWALFHGFIQLAIAGRMPLPYEPETRPTLTELRETLIEERIRALLA